MTSASGREPLLGPSRRPTSRQQEESATTNNNKDDDDNNTALEQVESALSHLVEWAELPAWMKDNHYIQTGYRRSTGKIRDSLRSLGYLHNESVNIYSHLIPGMIAMVLFIWGSVEVVWYVEQQSGHGAGQGLLPRYPSTTWQDYVVLSIFLAGCAGCLIMSSVYHCLNHHSEPLSYLSQRLDYLGIILLIVGSFIPTIYYGLYLYPGLMVGFWILTSVLGGLCIWATFNPTFGSPEYRSYRAGMFVLFGLSGILPVSAGLMTMGLKESLARCNFPNLVLMALSYIAGAVIYSLRFPERLSPGTFDIWGSSHQIFHGFVVLGAIFQFRCLFNAYIYCHTHKPN